nr:hypothetical protein [Tanacetum cinerariifolium]
MVACLERTNRNAEFNQIVDFLTTSPIHYALTVSPTIYASYIEQFWTTAMSKTVNDVKQIHAIVDGKTMIDLAEPFNDVYVTRVHTKKVFTNMKRQNKDFSGTVTPLFASKLVPQVVDGEGWDTEIPQSSGPPKKVGDEAAYTGEDDIVVRVATTATSLETEQENGNINKTRSTSTLNKPSPQGTSSGSRPRCQDTTLGDASAQTRFETAFRQSPDSPLLEVNTSGSRKDETEQENGNINKTRSTSTLNKPSPQGTSSGSRPRCQDTTLGDASAQTRFETAFRQSPDSPLLEVNTSGSRKDGMEHQDDLTNFVPPTPYDSPLLGGHTLGSDEAIKNVEGDTINAGGAVNTTTTRVSVASASVTTVGVSISTVEPRTPPTTTKTAFKDEDLTIAQTLVKIRSDKAKEKGVAFRDVEEYARPTTILPTIDPKDKGKGIMQELEKPPKNPRNA